MVTQDNKSLAVINHILGIFTGFIGPLIIFLLAKDKFSKDSAKAALNWQISLIIYSLISAVLVFVIIGILLIVVLWILNIVFPVIAALRANEGKVWKYPLSIPFFKV